MNKATILIPALVALSACQPDAPSAPSGDATKAADASTSTSTGTSAEPTAPQAAPATSLVVDAGGLATGRGSTRERLSFGAPRAAVEQAAGAATKLAPVRSENAECGAGPMAFTRYGALTLNFQDDKLVGWLAENGAAAVTVDGIRPGLDMAGLRNERSVNVIADSTLEGEFEYAVPDGSQLGGFTTPDGKRVASLYAGTNCFFR